MKKFCLLLVLCFSFGFLSAARQPIILDSIASGAYHSAPVPDFKSMQDARYYTCIDPSGKKLICFDYLTGKQKETILDLDKVKGVQLKKIIGYAFNSTENEILIWSEKKPIYRRSFTTEYFVYDCRRNYIDSLSENGDQHDASFSPDGRSIAFARDNNLFIKRLDYGTEIPVTTDDPGKHIINGTSDWVYEEEFEETNYYAWSPDSKFLAYVRFDENAVKTATFPLFGKNNTGDKYYNGFYNYKYPVAGETNSTVSVYAFNIQIRSAKLMNVPIAADDYIPRIRFTTNSSKLAVMTLNKAQNTFKMYYLNPKSATSTLILTDKNEKYVDPVYDAIHFTSKNFTYLSEKNGYRHLYLYGAEGGLLKQITSGKWDVTKYIGCDTIHDIYYYQSTEESPVKRILYRVDLKGRKEKISERTGVNDAAFNSDYSHFVQSWSDINTPPVYSVCDALGRDIRTIGKNESLQSELSKFKYAEKIFIKVPAADGEMLNGWMLKPVNFDPSQKYPVVQIQYSGPDLQSVLDKFDFDWEYYLSEKGFVVVCVDGRGTGGRGEEFRKCTYPNLGVLETQDQVATANYLKKLSYVDGSRIGIWGWSYGGYITLMSLTDKSGAFKAGVAVAPVCDWRFYDSVYTERYMKTPNENQSGYDAGSPILRAADLKGRLLLIHGMADDNVRVNQSIEMAEALIKAGVQFDMQYYPTSNHSISGATYRTHLYNRMVDFFIQNLQK